ncbi:PP0621 family protein [Yanghanlia caeni]|uniref:PP0621 family protein n=1 Tax=Yanghanlia caeni TaxID=3064283 RepID=A0ABU1D4R2_9BURK|nr:PP0621 family protein [Alcaligenaceae bacterium LG-2]
MGKILFWFVVILAVLITARLLARSGSGSQQAGRSGKGRPPAPADMSDAESMVRCAHCGIHMPRSEAYLSDGRTWCGQEHARLGVRTD